MTVGREPLTIRTSEYNRMAKVGVFDSDRRRIELIGGHLYEMLPIGTAHLMVVTRLQRLFERAIEEDLRVLVQQHGLEVDLAAVVAVQPEVERYPDQAVGVAQVDVEAPPPVASRLIVAV